MVVFLGGGGGYSALPAPIYARLCGWAGSVCPKQNHSPTLKCMLIVSYIDNIVPDRKLLIVSMPKVDYQNKS